MQKFSTNIEFPIATSTWTQYVPTVSDNVVVWSDMRNGNLDIYGRNLYTGEEFPICTDLGDQSYPVISGNIVIWEDWRDYNIFGKNLSTGTTFKISDTGSCRSPAISGNSVVWLEENCIVKLYDLTTTKESVVCMGNDLYHPDISGDLVVWGDFRNGNWDIYGAYIPEPATLLLFGLGIAVIRRRRTS